MEAGAVVDLFSDATRRDPYPAYDRIRDASPVLPLRLPQLDAWLVFDYDSVKRVLSDHDTFGSEVPAPRNWFLFSDPPRHTRLRALIARAFTPRVVADLEPRVRELSRRLLEPGIARGGMDLAGEYAVPLAMQVIAHMTGIPAAEWERFRRWSDVILRLSYDLLGGPEGAAALASFRAVTVEMAAYLAGLIEERRAAAAPADDLLTRLVRAEVDGERLTPEEILGFVQLLVVGGQETSANLISNSVLSLVEHPDQLARLRADPELIPSAIEEVLRYRSPLQWVMRTPRHDVELHGRTIPAGALVLPMIGSANRDPRQFPDPDRFDVTRDPNPHLAFGHGPHFCLGAPLARLEARVALGDLLGRPEGLELASREPWEPRRGLNVLGPARLPVRV